LDTGFIGRVYRTSAAVWVFALLWCAALRSVPAAVGITIGFAISVGSLMVLERLVTALFSPEAVGQARRATRKLLAVAFVKYAVIGAILWGALRSGWASPAGLVIGIGLPQAVMFLKAVGIALTFGPEVDRRL
jgi:hypothetical protein